MATADYDIYQMSEERQQALWSDCTFVFDASALLALYLYPEEARQFIYKEIFEKLKGRLWLPHHAYFEYLKNRASKIREPISRSYKPLNDDFISPIIDAFNRSLNRVDNLKNTLKNTNSHPYMVAEAVETYERKLKEFVSTTVEFGKNFNEQMEQKIKEILLLEQHDTVQEQIQYYFKIGREYSYEEILKITVEGKHRYEFKIPPGYEDLKDKIGTQIFGDLIIWKQILEYSKKNKKNIVFICNDMKEDWWHLVSDKGDRKRTQGPRKELIKELRDHSGKAFWMYNQARFVDLANTLVKSNVPNRHIEYISRLVASEALDKRLVYTCNACRHMDVLDLSALSLKFETAGNHQHVATTEFNCAHCGNSIQARFDVQEEPAGTIRNRKIVLTGAILADAGQLEDHLIEESGDEPVPLEEELMILNKKTLRLKAGKTRKINLGQSVDGNETLFAVGLIKPEDPTLIRRLLVEVATKQKQNISKTLIVEAGQTRFVLRDSEERFAGEFTAVQLTSDTDLTIALQVIRYSGSGRYLDKLYY